MTLEEAFPEVDFGIIPLGARIVVQIKTTKQESSGGIILVEDTKETEKWNTQIGKVVALGPLAFCNRETAKPWPEGMWAKEGEYVRVPRWGGDRFEVPIPGSFKVNSDGSQSNIPEVALFCVFNDHELIAKLTGDPLKFKNFIL